MNYNNAGDLRIIFLFFDARQKINYFAFCACIAGACSIGFSAKEMLRGIILLRARVEPRSICGEKANMTVKISSGSNYRHFNAAVVVDASEATSASGCGGRCHDAGRSR